MLSAGREEVWRQPQRPEHWPKLAQNAPENDRGAGDQKHTQTSNSYTENGARSLVPCDRHLQSSSVHEQSSQHPTQSVQPKRTRAVRRAK